MDKRENLISSNKARFKKYICYFLSWAPGPLSLNKVFEWHLDFEVPSCCDGPGFGGIVNKGPSRGGVQWSLI